ncbi:DNA metabolism protein [Lithospermum erythrorhizon]|uniref:DNA metabolism protein n=1 Tax=Lithospermum erythrorhizon TaxID=34254 RepID=A0AAV3P9S2_LITER
MKNILGLSVDFSHPFIFHHLYPQMIIDPTIESCSVLSEIRKMSIFNSINAQKPTEIVFFDLETNVPRKTGQKFWILEFGAIVVCPRKLVELESYCTLIRPGDLSVAALRPSRIDGITREAVADAPSFEEVADQIFSILDGRIWAGHNIQRFDCVRLKAAFAEIGKSPPVPIGMIDSLGILSEKFGKRAGNMKMASLATYFGLGKQKHRSLDDVRMNLEVLKHCATVLFLESSLPNMLDWRLHGSPNVTTRSRKSLEPSFPSALQNQSQSNPRSGRVINNPCKEGTICRKSPSSTTSLSYQRTVPYTTKESLRRMTTRVKDILCRAQSNKPLNNFFRHSHSLLR